MIRNQTDVRLVPNQSVHGKYNQISGWFSKISKRFLCVYVTHKLSAHAENETENKTKIVKRIREASVCRHNGGPTEAPP